MLLLALLTLMGTTHADVPAPVRAEAFASFDKLLPGATFRIAVVLDITAPWHINANPTTSDDMVATTLTWTRSPSVVTENIRYPAGKPTSVDWADRPVALYAGRVVVFTEARVPADARPGPVRLEGKVSYQACNDTVCLPPSSKHVTLQTTIGKPGETALPVYGDIFGAVLPPSNSIESLIHQRGWLLALGFVFLGGLALNLTPCVYPMIAITVSYFGGQSTGRAAFGKAFVYFLGIVVTYSTLGLIAATTGSLFGQLLQNPWMLAGIGALLVAMALSMFGLFELQPPRIFVQAAAGLSAKAGILGVFLLGATVGIIAAPCLAPFVVALLAFVGQQGDPWLGWWLFLVFSVGLGLPYIVLGMFSGLLARLPRSGAWMVWVKRIFGVVLIGAAAWITNSLWLTSGNKTGGIAWEPFAQEKLRQTSEVSRPVLIDFSADWCIPCKEMEKRTFSKPVIVEKSRQFLTLKADLTRSDSPEAMRLVEQFQIRGVPTIIFIGPDGRELAGLRQVGFVPAEQLLLVMDKALASAPAHAPAP